MLGKRKGELWMDYRTDLAIERKEIIDEESGKTGAPDGVAVEKADYGDDVKVTRIEITSRAGEMRMQKPMGNYITIEADGILEERDGIKDKVENVIAAELKKLIKFHYYLNVLVVGLGNTTVTPDALGPEAASKIQGDRTIFLTCSKQTEMMRCQE